MKRVLSVFIVVLIAGFMIFAFFLMQDKREDVFCQDLIIVIKDSTARQFLDEKDILFLLKNSNLNPVNQPFDKINTNTIREKIIENELVATANVFKTPSGKIKIEITQKMPILRVFSAQGSYYVDDLGNTMPADYRYATYLPIASGNIEKSLATTDLYKFALFLQKHNFWNNQIEQIYVHPDNEVELVPRVGNHRIILGNFEDFKEKMNNLQLFYEQAIPKLGWEKYEIINLKYKNQIVCTKK
jgi:cell division protein FtsQ